MQVIHDAFKSSLDELKKASIMSWLERYDFKENGTTEIVLAFPADSLCLLWNDTLRSIKKYADGYDPGNLATSKTCMRFSVEQLLHSKMKNDPWLDIKNRNSLAKARQIVIEKIYFNESQMLAKEISRKAVGLISQIMKKELMPEISDPVYFANFDYFNFQQIAPYKLSMKPYELGSYLLNENEFTAQTFTDGVARTSGKFLIIDKQFGMIVRKCFARSVDQSFGGKFCGYELDFTANDEVIGTQVHWGDEKKSTENMMMAMRQAVQELSEMSKKGMAITTLKAHQ